MEMLSFKEMLDRMAETNGVRWYGHLIRKDEGNDARTEWAAKAWTAKNHMQEAGGKRVGLKIEEAVYQKNGGKV